jgi:hypothetical protein
MFGRPVPELLKHAVTVLTASCRKFTQSHFKQVIIALIWHFAVNIGGRVLVIRSEMVPGLTQ